MATTTTTHITNLQPKVIGPARQTLKGWDDTYNSPKMPGVTAFGLTEDVDMVTETLVDSNVAVSATEVGVSVRMTNKMLRTVSRDQFLRDAGKAMGSAINVKEEQDLATLIDGYGTVVGLDGGSATIGQLSAALAQLRANSEPVNEAMFKDVSAVLHPYGWHDIALHLFPTGSGTAHAPDTAQSNRANADVLRRYWPVGDYFGTPIKISTNLVTSGSNARSGVFHKNSGLMYEFMPVDMDVDDSDKSKRSIELVMVIDYGQVEILDGHGREWDHDITAPTS